jgi:2-desacetyl-2-hydroxyethyl bacteriochlorophyllide A dehydrogenase
MKALVNTAPDRLEWKDWPKLSPGPNEVLIRTGVCGICATDLEMIHGWQRTGFPAIPGHEWAGIVDAVGEGVDASLAGKHCVAENVLADGGEVGFEHPGGYAEYLVTEARNVHVLPPNFPLAVAALIEPLAVCVRAMSRLRLQDKRSAIVFGDGAIGLLMLVLLKLEGVERVTLIGGRESRLNLAKQFGASAILNYHEISDIATAIAGLPGAPFGNVIEASGSPTAMKTAIEIAANCGKVLMIGDYADGRADFRWNLLLHHELELIGSNASAGAWTRAVELAVSGRVPLERLISRRMPASAGAEGVERVRQSRDLVKVVLEWV